MARRKGPTKKGEVLVAIMKDRASWKIAREQGWYRIPVKSAPWNRPPQWIAFYQTKVFGKEAFVVRYFAKVAEIRTATRRELFPQEPSGLLSGKPYYQVMLEQIEELPEPVPCLRQRRIVFILTTMYQLRTAEEINDLYGESPLEEAMWEALKSLKIKAERQYAVQRGKQWCFLDFAVFCKQGKVNIETDGDTWHTTREQVAADKRRDNWLQTKGWRVLRFTTNEVHERMEEYCVPTIVQNINGLGGLDDKPGPLPPDPGDQLGLFDDDDTDA
ncbi:MAG: DUF559 domain-containing protein [Fimbriimonadaceae bacterium]